MTNADRIRSLSDNGLAETYINVLYLNNPVVNGKAYQSIHASQIFYNKEDAIKAELDWLKSEVEE